jgi:hypothetical protein
VVGGSGVGRKMARRTFWMIRLTAIVTMIIAKSLVPLRTNWKYTYRLSSIEKTAPKRAAMTRQSQMFTPAWFAR